MRLISLTCIFWLVVACGSDTGGIRKAEPGAAGTPSVGTPSGLAGGSGGGLAGGTPSGPCLDQMVFIDDLGGYCIDRYEARIAQWSPFEVAQSGSTATVEPGEPPQGYISGDVAAEACALAGKRLCTAPEWMRACEGPSGTLYPYGNQEDPEACNTARGVHPVVELFGVDADWSPTQMNDPRLNQLPDSLDAAGANPACVSADGVYDLHGNLHEWIDDPDGTFRGGFYVDAVLNGAGCTYTTTAHSTTYHDYSTGFRCCADG